VQTIIDKLLGGKRWCCLDFESNGLLDSSEKAPAATKIWVMGYWDFTFGKEVKYTVDTEEMKAIINDFDVIFVHNGYLFDTLLTEKLLGYSFNSKIFDTLPLSYYLYPARIKHGLKEWGADLGVIKPTVDDWSHQPLEVYVNRVTEDVKIQSNLTFKFVKDLLELYDNDIAAALNLWDLLNSIFDLYNEQYKNPFYLNMPLLENNIQVLTEMKQEKEKLLEKHMPPIPVVVEKCRPSVMYKKSGEISSLAIKWYEFLDELGADPNVEKVKYVKSYTPPNASSVDQIKQWLFSLSWKPEIFKDAENVRGEIVKVPQTKDKEGNLCSSVIKLAAEYPVIKEYEDLSVINHRLGILKGFEKNRYGDTIYGDVAGLTNTLRVKHRRLVNLCKVSAKFGEYIRPCLIPNLSDGEVLIGADVKALEATTKVNMICDIDPTTLHQFLDEDFDTHLDLAVFAESMSEEEMQIYKDLKAKSKNEHLSEAEHVELERLNNIRNLYKMLNYACLYNASPRRIAKELGISIREGEALHSNYWKKNYSIKLKTESAPTKNFLGTKWIYNDIIGIFFECRSDHTKFSALNQGLGSVLFFNWVREFRSRGVKCTANFHDEVQIRAKKEDVENIKTILRDSMDAVSEKFKLKVKLSISIDTGNSYGDTH
jgi:hypothetical protein